jgi:phosphoribosyl 1,2-cyclic phosphodiesterase
MRVRFWGTRGSLPVALTAPQVRGKIVAALAAARGRAFADARAIEDFVDGELGFALAGTFGGHSSCVQVETGGEDYLLCDLGSGARPFAVQTLRERRGRPATYHVLMSHLHWDHIMGFPFFAPAYIPGNRVRIYGCHAELAQAFQRQQDPPSFPVPLSALGAQIEFVRLTPGQAQDIAGARVTPMLQRHTGDSFGYRIEAGGSCVVYTTDSEHRPEDAAEAQSFVDFFEGAGLVIFDAMYSLADAVSVKQDWGHSSNVVGVELCQRAHVRRLCLFHHEPVSDDSALAKLLEETRRFEELTREDQPLEVLSAYDGLVIDV